MLVLLAARTAASPGIPTFAAADFVASVGVNTHLHHAGSFYDLHFDQVVPRLLAAHIGHVRDGATDRDGGFAAGDVADRFAALGRAGIRVTFIFRPWVTREFVTGWPARVAPAFEAYEAPNEFNLQKAVPWSETLRAWLPRLAQYVREDPGTARYPILGPSIADLGGEPQRQPGDLSASFDFGNVHKYYRAFAPANDGYGARGTAPCEAYRYGQLDYALCQARRISAGKPMVCTEAGYGSGTTPGRELSRELQARYLVRMLLLHFKAGLQRTFVYQLADSGDDAGANFGLLDADGAEKPAYRQLAGLLGELGGPPPPAPPVPLPVAISGAPATLEALGFARADGGYRLVLWLETPSADPRTSQPLTVPAQPVRLELPPNYRFTAVVSFAADGRAAVRPVAGARTLEISVTDNPALVRVVPFVKENS
jgi:hypothetical protein